MAITSLLALRRPASEQLVSLLAWRRGLSALSAEVATGINLEKKGSDPSLRADEELPEWLWAMATPSKPLSELRRNAKTTELDFDDLARMAKLENRDGIRTRNESKAK